MLDGWGRYPSLTGDVAVPRHLDDATSVMQMQRPLIARGNGRSYGDSAVSPDLTLDMRSFNRFLDFDSARGRLTVEAGVLLADVVNVALRHGWFPPVTPGTQFVTIGGMVASNVHGKNHHLVGNFGDFIDWIDLIGPDGQVRRCSRTKNENLFNWTLGGMGLTGIITKVAFRLKSVETGWITQEVRKCSNLSDTMDEFEKCELAQYSVAWIDCLTSGPQEGRSLLMLGSHATLDQFAEQPLKDRYALNPRLRLNVPFDAPKLLLSRPPMRLFNSLYYRFHNTGASKSFTTWEDFFYPLDRLRNWNRLYGASGFVQVQFALPMVSARKGISAVLQIAKETQASPFLGVLKKFGPDNSLISFPMLGYTMAMDLPVRAQTFDFLARIESEIIDQGGRFYLTKDSWLSAKALRESDPRFLAFREYRQSSGMAGVFESKQSLRLGI